MPSTTNNSWPYPASTDPVGNGATNFQQLAQGIDTSVGTGLLAWSSWAPTLSGGWLNGNGTWTATYSKLGKLVHVRAKFVVGSTTTKGTTMTISLPVTAATNAVNTTSTPLGFAISGGVNTHLLTGIVASTTAITMYAVNAAGTYIARTNITSAIPATWATNDEIHFTLTYEAA